MAENGTVTVSWERLAEATDVNSAKVRKDLSHLGSYGTRGVGYDVAYLIHQVRRELGLTQHWPVLIAGIGNLGNALANYKGFAERGFKVVVLVDSDPKKIGTRVAGMRVADVSEMPRVVADNGVAIAMIFTPGKVDLSLELQILAFYEQRKAALAAVQRGRAVSDMAQV